MASLNKLRKHLTFKNILIGIGILILAIFIAIDINDRYLFSITTKEVKAIQQQIMAMPQAKQISWHDNGDGFFDNFNCFPDENCPYVFVKWEVPVKVGEEDKLLKELITRNGFTSDNLSSGCSKSPLSCQYGGNKGEMYLGVGIARILPKDLEKKDKIPNDFEWRTIQARVTYY